MKTITFKDSNISLYLIPDTTYVAIGESITQVGDPPEFMIGDCMTKTALLYENVTPPDDWAGHKYLFDGTTWTPNPKWVEPKPE